MNHPARGTNLVESPRQPIKITHHRHVHPHVKLKRNPASTCAAPAQNIIKKEKGHNIPSKSIPVTGYHRG